MDQKEEEAAPRCQYSGDLLDGRFERLDVLDGQAEQNRVEPGIPKGKLVRTGLQVPREASSIVRGANLGPTGIEGDHLRPLSGEAPADLPLTATDVQHPSRTACVALDQRKDQLLVLGVGSFGEVPLPPGRPLLPEVILHLVTLQRG